MAAFIFLFIFNFIILHCISSPTNGPIMPCSSKNPSIHQFPFLPKNQERASDTRPMWKMTCKDNFTTLHFPSYGDLIVKAIFYDTKRINLIDPKNCVHGVFLKLDLTSTPFSYFYALKNYTYLNCSASLPPSFLEIPCLSSSNYHVYTVDPSVIVPDTCKKVKNVPIPFTYNPYISDNSFGLGLTWNLPRQDDEFMLDEKRQLIQCFHISFYKASVSILCFILLILITIKLCQLKKYHDKKGRLSEAGKLLDQYSTLNLTRYKNVCSDDKLLNIQFGSFTSAAKMPAKGCISHINDTQEA